MMELNSKLKRVDGRYTLAKPGEDFCGYYAGSMNEMEFVVMIPAGHSVVFFSEPIELLDLEHDNV